jgi:hypothetical protein
MKPSNPWLLGLLLLVAGVSPALAAVPLADAEDDRRAKQAVPPSGRALVYVYRHPDSGPELSPILFLNRRAIGRLSPRTYTLQAVEPGRVDLRAGGAEARTLSLRCQDGRIYFVRLEAGAGGAELRQVAYGTGRREVHAARLARETGDEQRAARADEAERGPARSGFNLILKGGGLSLSSETQNIEATSNGGSTTIFQTTFDQSAPAFGLEGEWIMRSGWAYGGELIVHAHDYVTVPAGALGSGEMRTIKLLFNAKKYFRPGSIVQPYVGAGVGLAVVNMSGQVEGNASGYAAQAMGGVVFRWEFVGFYTEAKFQVAEAADVDASGTGLFAGVSFHF